MAKKKQGEGDWRRDEELRAEFKYQRDMALYEASDVIMDKVNKDVKSGNRDYESSLRYHKVLAVFARLHHLNNNIKSQPTYQDLHTSDVLVEG